MKYSSFIKFLFLIFILWNILYTNLIKSLPWCVAVEQNYFLKIILRQNRYLDISNDLINILY